MDMDMYNQPTEPRPVYRGSGPTDRLEQVRQPNQVGWSPADAQENADASQLTVADQGTTVPMSGMPAASTMHVLPPAPPPPAGTQSRRKFMGKSLAGLAAAGGAALIGGVGLEQWFQRGGWNGLFHGPLADSAQTGHLLRRAGFGATPDELNMYRGLGYQGAVDRLLNYAPVSDDAMEQRLQTLKLDLNNPTDQQRWWLLRMAWTQRPLLEKMTLFWHGVLTSSYHKVGGPKNYMRMIVQNNFLRAHAFDTFDNLLLGITSDPAMLFYLDLTKSTKSHPNENYARELMELFTLGLGNYTQQDVYEAAAALTGWHVQGMTSKYYPRDHNDLTKTYLGHTGNLDYRDVVKILANHPATPWFISRKLFTFFAYENPSVDDLKPLVNAYVQSGHNMGAVMRALLLSPQFSSAQAYRGRVKSPVEFAVGAYRALGIQGDGTGLPAIVTMMGQTVFDPPNVAGWPGDKVSALWLNSGTWMTRLNYLDLLLARGTIARSGATPLIDLQGMIHANQLDTPENFVDHFSSHLLDSPLPADRRGQLLDYFTGQGSNVGRQTVALTSGKTYPLNRVRGTLYLLMASPEYQLN